MKDHKKTMAEYCRKEIEDYELKEKIAMGYIDRMRCPLSMADPAFFDEMQEKIEEYCEDNDLDPTDYDVEEIFWEE